MKTCPTCQTDLTGSNGKVRFCSPACRDSHGNTRRSLRVSREAVLNHQNCMQCGLPHLTKRSDAKVCSKECRWNQTNNRRTTGFYKLRYSSRVMPKVDRILSIVGRATPRQKCRFADLLLRFGGPYNKHHLVDDFLANYNTQGI